MTERDDTYGLMAEFPDPETLLDAAAKVHEAGYRRIDAFSPFPIKGLPDALGFGRTKVPLIVLLGGLAGGLGGYAMMLYSATVDYPLNVGGRPLNSWPAFIPITFELTILIAGLSAVIGMLILNGFPSPYHPVFNVEAFREHATRDGFFLLIESEDAKFDPAETRRFMEEMNAVEVHRVDW